MVCAQKIIKLIVIGFGALTFMYYFDINYRLKQVYFRYKQSHYWLTGNESVPDGYLVWSPQCKISSIDPWDASISKYFDSVKEIKCSDDPLLTYIEPRNYIGNVLKVNEVLMHQLKNKWLNEILCCYSIIIRITEKYRHYTNNADQRIFITRCKYFKTEAILKNTSEFIIVKCIVKGSRKSIYSNVHAATPKLPRIMKKIFRSTHKSKIGNNTDERKLSVMLVGLDAVSRLSFHRSMPRALKFLEKNKWVELKGYSKVNLNTFPNLLAVLNGQNLRENLEKCTVIDSKKPKKNICPLIWNDFKKKGYVTAYAEDSPDISTFNYLKVGFVEQPTDYYLRPMMIAAQKLLSIERVCVGPESYLDHILNYAKNFSKTFKNFPYFGFFWSNSFTHDDINLHTAVDFPLTNFLMELENIGVYENTIVVLFSDHGMRIGEFCSTLVGFYEDRLPFIFIWLPQWFKKKFPEKYKNLLKNQNRLTTPYDLHLTLKEVLEGNVTSKAKGCPKCVSLFKEIPWNRNCKDAGIGKGYCMCSSIREHNMTHKLSIEIGEYLNQYIVNKTQFLLRKYSFNKRICANRVFSKLVKSFEIMKNDEAFFILDDERRIREYVIVIESNPGPSLFEAQVMVERFRSESFKITITSSVNRLDSYAETSNCVNILSLKELCHCV